MRKKIAIFANGWGSEYLQQVGNGISKCAAEADADVFAFINFSIHIEGKSDNQGEFSIFTLPDLKDFDGVILLTNSFNLQREITYLKQVLAETSIPAVSLLCPIEGAAYVGINNFDGVKKLTTHLIVEHNVKNIVFIGGFREHEDCKERLRAVLAAARENQLTIPEQNILFGDWSAKSAIVCIKQWLEEQKVLPDAVICANDIMAIGVCNYLEKLGIKVPQDVKVTGYDCIRPGQEHWPILTTVSQNWEELGVTAMQSLLEQMEGKNTLTSIEIGSKVIYGESCGCGMETQTDGLRREKAPEKFDGMATDQHFRHMYRSVRKVKSREDLHRSFTNYYKEESWMEGPNTMLCLNPKFFETADSVETMQQTGFPDQMDMVCCMLEEEGEAYQRISRSHSVFHVAERSASPGIYLFVPLHSEDITYGYAMMNRSFEIVGDNLLYIWTRHLGQYLEQVRSNIYIEELTNRLAKMSVTDGLTQLYNRMGYETIMEPEAKYVQSSGGQVIVMIADLDHLKIINDTYGHANGDKALFIVAQAMKKSLPDSFRVARFGGDEFLAIGTYCGGMVLEKLEAQIEDRVKKDAEEQNITFPLSVSIGGVLLDKGVPFELSECLPRADLRMYQTKEEHHNRMKNQCGK